MSSFYIPSEAARLFLFHLLVSISPALFCTLSIFDQNATSFIARKCLHNKIHCNTMQCTRPFAVFLYVNDVLSVARNDVPFLFSDDAKIA